MTAHAVFPTLPPVAPPGPRFAAWAAAARAVTDRLTETAAARDAAGRPPVAEVQLLREAGLLTIAIPADLGGGGASVTEILRIIRILAEGDTSIAQLASYHFFGSTLALRGANRALAEKRLNGLLHRGWFHAGIAQAAYEPLIEARATAGGFVLNGAKPFTSGAAVADSLHVWVRFATGTVIDGQDAGGHIGQFIVANPSSGLSFGDDWDNIGQRLTVSGSAALKNVVVGRDDLVQHYPEATEHPPHVTVHVPLIQLAFAELYVGTARGALAATRDYVHAHGRPWVTSPALAAGDDVLVIERFGRLSAALASAEALADAAGAVLQQAIAQGEALTEAGRGHAAAVAYQAKIHATEVALEVTSRLFELTGARSTARSFALDRFWRNVRTHSTHDPVHYKVIEVGDWALNGRDPAPTYYS